MTTTSTISLHFTVEQKIYWFNQPRAAMHTHQPQDDAMGRQMLYNTPVNMNDIELDSFQVETKQPHYCAKICQHMDVFIVRYVAHAGAMHTCMYSMFD